MKIVDKSFFLWRVALNIKVSNDGFWQITQEGGRTRYIDIVGIKLMKPSENDITLLQVVIGPVAVAIGVL